MNRLLRKTDEYPTAQKNIAESSSALGYASTLLHTSVGPLFQEATPGTR
jgi:hypothetical protein